MILLIDNYDSFVFNLALYTRELGFDCVTKRNDEISLAEITSLQPSHIILSPGPCAPDQAGICLELVKTFADKIPMLGVCLGHQVIGQAFGGKVIKAKTPMHGRACKITHDDSGIFSGLENPLTVARYHSLVVAHEKLPTCLHIQALSEDGEIMALKHKSLPLFGVQFHPESILTQFGHQLLKHFFTLTFCGYP